MQRFLITDVNTSYNKGDAAIVLGMIKIIKQIYPESSISVLTPTPNEDMKYYSRYGVKTHQQLFGTMNRTVPKIILGITHLFRFLYYLFWKKFTFLPLRPSERIALDLYCNADIIISCSGGRLGGGKLRQIITILIPIYLAKKFRKKVFVCAQSVEPFRNYVMKKLVTFVLNKVDCITVRESISFNTLKSINLKVPIGLTADLAFLLDAEKLDLGNTLLQNAGIFPSNKIRIGMTVTNWRAEEKGPKDKEERFVDTITDAIEQIIKEHDAVFVLFPQVIISPNEDDRIISNKIKQNITKSLSSNIFVLTENYTPQQLKSMMGNMDIFIGKRLHSCIFTLSQYLPTIVIGYEKKALGIMKMLDMEEYLLDVNTLSSKQIVMKVNHLLENRRKITQILKEKIPHIKRESYRNGDFIMSLLNKN